MTSTVLSRLNNFRALFLRSWSLRVPTANPHSLPLSHSLLVLLSSPKITVWRALRHIDPSVWMEVLQLYVQWHVYYSQMHISAQIFPYSPKLCKNPLPSWYLLFGRLAGISNLILARTKLLIFISRSVPKQPSYIGRQYPNLTSCWGLKPGVVFNSFSSQHPTSLWSLYTLYLHDHPPSPYHCHLKYCSCLRTHLLASTLTLIKFILCTVARVIFKM